VPCIIEWPAVITSPRTTSLPCTTSDIYPTILELLGVNVEQQPLLDGESIASLLRDAPTEREHGIGFWVFDAAGNPAKSGELLVQMRDEQLGNIEVTGPIELTPECRMEVTFDLGDRRGHAAWMEGDWKLHRITPNEGEPRFELYHLGDDPTESNNVVSDQPALADALKASLDDWQSSVINSLNGADY
jgi:arylsulfatase A-like enzyme